MNILPKDQLLSLTRKTAIVTGGSEGIGYAIAYRLAEAGARVVIASRGEEAGRLAVSDIQAAGHKDVMYVACDVSREEDVKKLIEAACKAYDTIDILVNNAGIFPYATLHDLTAELFDQVVAINLRGVFLMTKYVSEVMIAKQHGGKIINITSIDALHPSMVGLAHYDATKHGVWGFTKNVAIELAKHQIWVNAVAPGGILTPGVSRMQGADTRPPRNPEPTPMDIAMGRMGVPDDIGKVVLFLASDMASYMTGTQVVVDGGYLLK